MSAAPEHRYREIFRRAAVPLWELDLTAMTATATADRSSGPVLVAVNDAALVLHGARDAAELDGALERVFLPETLRDLGPAVAALARRETHAEVDVVFGTLDGRRLQRAVVLDALPASGSGLRAILTVLDPKGRLNESELRFRTMADSAPVLLWMAGVDSECDYFNRGWLDFSGRPMERELGVGWADGVHFEDFQHAMHVYMTSFVERRAFKMEYRLRRADGEFRWILDHGVPRFGPDGLFSGFIGSCIDITAQKDLEVALVERIRERTAQLAERDTLLREVHHRVKNNLQVLSSLLSLQARSLQDVASRSALEESQGRVFSIALVHERLYRSDDLAHIDLGEYVRGVTEHVLHTHGFGDGRVKVTIEVIGTTLAVDQAIPSGLILHELLTNALKYAFRDGRHGQLWIRGFRVGDEVVLEVQDDGPGLPEEIDPTKPASLGLLLVKTLAQQLDAQLDVLRGPGTTFRLRFGAGG